MAEIYHMVPAQVWSRAAAAGTYAPESLALEGFIHCTAGERNLMDVASRYYRDEPGDWLVLVIDPARVAAEIRWVVQPDGLAYPHLHGPLNFDAVIDVCRFPRRPDGAFGAFRELHWSGSA